MQPAFACLLFRPPFVHTTVWIGRGFAGVALAERMQMNAEKLASVELSFPNDRLELCGGRPADGDDPKRRWTVGRTRLGVRSAAAATRRPRPNVAALSAGALPAPRACHAEAEWGPGGGRVGAEGVAQVSFDESY